SLPRDLLSFLHDALPICASAVDRVDTNVEGFENGLDQADRLKVVIDDQDVRGHLFRALGVGHKIESHHQLDELLPVDWLGQDLRSEEHTSELQSPYDLVC